MKFAALLLFTLLSLPLATARECRIVFLQRPADAPRTASLHLPSGEATEVELPSLNLSPRYKLPAGALNLSLTKPGAPPEQGARVTVPESVGDCYLLLVSDPKREDFPASVKVVDANQPGFSPGSMLWINGTPATVAGTLGDSRLMAKPGTMTIVRPPLARAGSYPVAIGYTLPGDEQVRPLCRTNWQHLPKSRHLVFVVMDPARKNTPRLVSIEDSPPPEPPADN